MDLFWSKSTMLIIRCYCLIILSSWLLTQDCQIPGDMTFTKFFEERILKPITTACADRYAIISDVTIIYYNRFAGQRSSWSRLSEIFITRIQCTRSLPSPHLTHVTLSTATQIPPPSQSTVCVWAWPPQTYCSTSRPGPCLKGGWGL